jgi:tetratricopeptide (TPR) repeat protein
VRVWEASPVPAEVSRRRALVSDVHALFTELLWREQVLAALRKDPTLNQADREFAIQVAQTHSEDAHAWEEAAWAVVKSRDAGTDAYREARRRAEAAVRLVPGDGNMLLTLGAAQYRLGDYANALDTLEHAEKLIEPDSLRPSILTFLALAHYQLGHKEQAQATLGRLQKAMKQPKWTRNADAQSYLREAEELIGGKAADNRK